MLKARRIFFKILRGLKFVSTEIYNCLLRTYVHAGKVPTKISELVIEDNIRPDEETEILLKQIDDS